MKFMYTRLLVAVIFALSSFAMFGQIEHIGLTKPTANVPVLSFQKPDLTSIHQENAERDRSGHMYRFGVGIDVNVTTQNTGIWTTDAVGNKIWRLKIKYPGAQALSFYFSKFYLYGASTINVLDVNGTKLHKTFSAKDVEDHGMQNLALCYGDNMMLELVEPKGTQSSVLEMNQIMYAYRSISKNENKNFGSSESCQVNVNCSEGASWQDEKRGVARILVVAGNAQGWCSGSLINNLAQDCKPYFLTAMHCADGSSTANMANWRFYFKYEAAGCTDPNSEGSLGNNFISGCLKLAGSNDVNGNTIAKSDFLLVKMGTASNESTIISTLKSANFQAYWNGWDANNVTSASGVGIHHPAGDIKKISTYTSNMSSTSYSGMNANTHWQVQWSATANGHGVTEGGSSGSPIFNAAGNSRIKGVLSGGSSFCTAVNSPDLYGKLAYSWTTAGSTNETRLKPWLDPANTGTLVMDGSADPCGAPVNPITPVADFSANQTNVAVGTTVNFTDLSTNNPTSWSWGVTPNTGVTYAGGTSSTSQNPQMTFATAGTYTVALTASNTAGSNTKTRTAYIIVSASSGPCVATSTECDEYIANVELNTINNASNCSNYIDYSSISTTLNAGGSYTATVATGIVGSGVGYGYTDGDFIGVWIDYNNNGSFTDANETIGVLEFSTTYTGEFPFVVPANVTPGTVRMRVRIDYLESGTISPCGTRQYGEVEDYRINLVGGSNVGIEGVEMDAISVFPNPASESITINMNANFQNAHVSILDLTGKEVMAVAKTNTDQVFLSTADLATGVYQVVITTEVGKVVKRIVKK